jgi:hypothetical protein
LCFFLLLAWHCDFFFVCSLHVVLLTLCCSLHVSAMLISCCCHFFRIAFFFFTLMSHLSHWCNYFWASRVIVLLFFCCCLAFLALLPQLLLHCYCCLYFSYATTSTLLALLPLLFLRCYLVLLTLQIPTSLFEPIDISGQTLTKNLTKLLDNYALKRKIIAYVNNEGSNLNTMTIAI